MYLVFFNKTQTKERKTSCKNILRKQFKTTTVWERQKQIDFYRNQMRSISFYQITFNVQIWLSRQESRETSHKTGHKNKDKDENSSHDKKNAMYLYYSDT